MDKKKEKRSLEVRLYTKEKEYYRFIFNKYSKEIAGKKCITNDDVRDLFSKAKIQMKELAFIWNHSMDEKKCKDMDEKSFFRAMKLVAVQQKNGTLDQLYEDCKKEMPLPIFDQADLEEFQKRSGKKEDSPAPGNSSSGGMPSLPKEEVKKEMIPPSDDIPMPPIVQPFVPLQAESKPPMQGLEDLEAKASNLHMGRGGKKKGKSESQEEESKDDKKEIDDLSVQVPQTEYVKSGYFGMSSYTIYKVETKSTINGFDPRKLYVVYRRFSDFEWLLNALQSEEKYQGCIFPPLPAKKLLGNTSEQFVEKRRQELQLFLQMLARHTLIKYDSGLRLFLPCESSKEFETYKSNPKEYVGESSIAVNSLKHLQIKDTLSYLYSTLKSKLWNTGEPAEIQSEIRLEETEKKIDKYLPAIEALITCFQASADHMKAAIDRTKTLGQQFSGLEDEDAELEKTYKTVEEYMMKRDTLLRGEMKYDLQLLDEIKEEKMRMLGMKSAISERKSQIASYNVLSEYAQDKMAKLQQAIDSSAKEELEKLGSDLEKAKEKIIRINKNLKRELENYSRNRNSNLKKIMSIMCFVQKEKARKVLEFVAERQKDFPLFEYIPEPMKGETGGHSHKKGSAQDEFKSDDEDFAE